MDSKPLDVFSHTPLTDGRIRKYELFRYPSEQVLDQATNPPEITIDTRGAALDNLVLLERAYLQVKYKLYKADKITPATSAKSQIIQNGWSLFSRANLYIAGSEVEQVDSPSYVSFLKRLITHTKDEIKGQGPSQCFYPQEALSAITLGNDAAAEADYMINRGVVAQATTGSDHWMKLNLRDVFGFCDIDKAILGGSIRLRLQPESAMEKVLWRKHVVDGSNNLTQSDAAYVRIQQIDLMLPICRPDNETLTSIYTQVKAGKTMPFEYERWNYYRLSIASGTTAENAIVPNSSKRPSAVCVYMQLAADESSATFTTPGRYFGRTFSASTHRLLVDSKVYPEISYQGSNNGYIHEYETFLQLGNKHHQDVFGSFVDKQLWENVYPVFCYDLSALRDELGSVRSLPPAIRWEMNHSDPGATAVAHIITIGKEYKEFNMVNDVLINSAPQFKD